MLKRLIDSEKHSLIGRSLAAATLLLSISSAGAEDFSYRNMLSARMKLDDNFDYAAHAESYMSVFRPVVYKTYREDEFQFRKKKKETEQMMKNAAKGFSLDTVMTIRSRLTLGNYDFVQRAFPVVESSDSHYWYTSRPNYGSEFPSRFEVYVHNRQLLRYVAMSEQAAESFIAQRKNRWGDVNRTISATIHFKIHKWREGTNEFDIDVQSIEFYSDQARMRRILTVKKRPAEGSSLATTQLKSPSGLVSE